MLSEQALMQMSNSDLKSLYIDGYKMGTLSSYTSRETVISWIMTIQRKADPRYRDAVWAFRKVLAMRRWDYVENLLDRFWIGKTLESLTRPQVGFIESCSLDSVSADALLDYYKLKHDKSLSGFALLQILRSKTKGVPDWIR